MSTGSASEADDITQEVFLKAYRALAQFEGRSQFFTWVYRMTVNRSLNARRDRARRVEDIDDPRLELAVAVDARSNPGRAAELRQTYSRLLRALDGLPVEMRTTVILVSLQGMSHGEDSKGLTGELFAWIGRGIEVFELKSALAGVSKAGPAEVVSWRAFSVFLDNCLVQEEI